MITKLSASRIESIKAEQYIHNTFMIVKELVENSIDANSTVIKIFVNVDLIIVEDNGNGICINSLDNIGKFGYTSKIKTTYDVLEYKPEQFTYGFRGQALHSIKKMGVTEITTSILEEPGIGIKKNLTTGKSEKLAKEKGMTIKITNLFENYPIRKKYNNTYYKKHILLISEYLESMCIVFNGTFVFNYTEKTKTKELIFNGEKTTLRDFLVRRYGKQIFEHKCDLFNIYFFPISLKNEQLIFSGIRLIKTSLSRLIEKTCLKFKDILPSYVLFIKTSTDINVSPDKMEIIYHNKQLLESLLLQKIEIFMSNNYFLDSVDYKKIRLSSISQNENNNSISQSQNHPIETFLTQKNTEQDTKPAIIDEDISDIKPVKNTIQFVKEENIDFTIEKADFNKMEVIGQFNKGFILCKLIKQDKSYLILVDQHAADEIKNFEYLKNTFTISKQSLITPIKLTLNSIQKLILKEHSTILNKNGFIVDVHNDSFWLKTVPQYKGHCFSKDDLYDLISKLKDSSDPNIMCSKFEDIMASKACRQSEMIGTHLPLSKLINIVQNLSLLNIPWKCPHGRPTFIIIQQMYI